MVETMMEDEVVLGTVKIIIDDIMCFKMTLTYIAQDDTLLFH